MRKFANMTTDEVTDIISKDVSLRNILAKHIQQCEMDSIDDKLQEFENDAMDYSIDPWTHSYINVKNSDSFVAGVESSGDNYGLGEKTDELLQKCKNLRGTNLYDFWVQRLCQSYFNEEIKPSLDFIEESGYELSCGKGDIGNAEKYYIDNLVDNYLGVFLWDEETETYYVPNKVCDGNDFNPAKLYGELIKP